ncbi:hypothetical protein K3495_g11994 [Podosphaera aphanis]|nr:hypothetical protein K3495_g11994 [Podosphaera aphanis]
MSLTFLLKNAGGFEQWRRTVTERAAQLLTEDLLETENDNAADPSLSIERPTVLGYNATTQEIALWEARERQYIIVHTRIQQLLEYMKTLNPSSKSAETDLKTRLAKLERSAKTTDIDIWLNSWIQIENIAKNCNYNWASEIIDRFHASLGHRSDFFATSFAALVWIGSITLPALAEQFRLCEAKLKRFEHIGAQELDNVFHPPVSLVSIDQEQQKPDHKQDNKKEKSNRCLCGIKYHSIKECYLFNPKARPKTWADRRSFASKQRLFNLATEPEKRKQLEKELGHRLPREILELPAEESSSAVETSNYENLYDDNYITESQTSYDRSEPESSYMLALTTSQTSLP